MKIGTIIACLLFSIAGFSQLQTYYHPNGTKRSEGEFLNGKKHGEWRDWDSTGQLISSISYADGLRDGPFTLWTASKATDRVLELERNLGNPSGIQKHEGHFTADKLNGEYKIWFSNDSLYEHSYYRNGSFDRFRRLYDPNGTLRIKAHYKNGAYHGTWDSYTKDGKPRKFRLYDRGKLKLSTDYAYFGDGHPRLMESHIYDEKGNPIAHGNWKEFHLDGQTKSSTNYKHGKLDGEMLGYYANGQLKYRAQYKKGKLISWEDFE